MERQTFKTLVPFGTLFKVSEEGKRMLSPQGLGEIRDVLSRYFDTSNTGDVTSFTALQDGVGPSEVMDKQDCVGTNISPGKFLARLSKHMHHFGFKLDDEIKETVATIANRSWVGGQELYGLFTHDLNWRIGDFGENPNTNCWVGSRLTLFKKKMAEEKAAAICLYRQINADDAGNLTIKKFNGMAYTGVGRGWLVLDQPETGAALLFNVYGPLTAPALAATLSALYNWPSPVKLAPVYIGGDLTINHDTNGNPAAYQIGMATDRQYFDYSNPSWAERTEECIECGDHLPARRMVDTENGFVCQDCLADYYVQVTLPARSLFSNNFTYYRREDAVEVLLEGHRTVYIRPQDERYLVECPVCNHTYLGENRIGYWHRNNQPMCSQCQSDAESKFVFSSYDTRKIRGIETLKNLVQTFDGELIEKVITCFEGEE